MTKTIDRAVEILGDAEPWQQGIAYFDDTTQREEARERRMTDGAGACRHQSESTPDGNGAFCRFCGETLR